MEDALAEIEAVCSIWEDVETEKMENLVIVKHKIKSMENEETSASVRIECTILEGYPSKPPIVRLSNPRGIGEKDFEELKLKIDKIVEDNDEMPIICEIFQNCCDFLTERQHTTDLDCSICLQSLCDFSIIVTECDHFLHAKCFSNYLKHVDEEIQRNLDETQSHLKFQVDTNIYCPVCRFVFATEEDQDFHAKIHQLQEFATKNQKTLKKRQRRSSTTTEDVSQTLKNWRKEQVKLGKVFEKQKKRGGIIDENEERKKKYFYINDREEE